MNRLDEIVDRLVAAIEPVLPGRTYATPPDARQTAVAPAIWIGDDTGFPSTIGERTAVTVATFPIWIVYDGAVRAQVEGLRQLRSSVLDAVARVPGAERSRWRAEPVDPNSNLRASVVEVDVTITATTFCVPDPVTVGAT